MKKGLLLVVSGPAGSGKGTVNSQLIATGDFVFSVSATTRAARPGEIDGKNYHFISREDFEQRIADGDMLEHTEYCGNLYGTPKKEAEEVLNAGKNLILEIEVEGAKNVKAKYPDAVLILLIPPSFSIQERRLRARGTETEEKILERLARTKEEMLETDVYDYVVYNYDGRSEEAVQKIIAIVSAEQSSMKRARRVGEDYLAN